MVNRKLLLSAFGAAALSVATVASLNAWETANKTAYLSFNAPVGLPGVGLAPGTYIFELAAPEGDVSIVRVSSRDRSTVYFMAFTEMIPRPAGVRPGLPIRFGEAPPGVPVPITVWYPVGESTGRRFIYHGTDRQTAEQANHR